MSTTPEPPAQAAADMGTGLDGIAAFRQMRESVPGQRVILMTAHTAQDEMDAAVRAGVWRVFPKPLDLPALFTALA